jgi:hypothetical protein
MKPTVSNLLTSGLVGFCKRQQFIKNGKVWELYLSNTIRVRNKHKGSHHLTQGWYVITIIDYKIMAICIIQWNLYKAELE